MVEIMTRQTECAQIWDVRPHQPETQARECGTRTSSSRPFACAAGLCRTIAHGHFGVRAGGRRGAAIVEFALVAPLLFLLALGLVEYARLEMVLQGMTAAAQEGCRAGIVPGSRSADVTSNANAVLRNGLITGASVTVNPPEVATLKQGHTFTVTVQVPMDGISWLPRPLLPKSKVLKSQCTMVRESK